MTGAQISEAEVAQQTCFIIFRTMTTNGIYYLIEVSDLSETTLMFRRTPKRAKPHCLITSRPTAGPPLHLIRVEESVEQGALVITTSAQIAQKPTSPNEPASSFFAPGGRSYIVPVFRRTRDGKHSGAPGAPVTVAQAPRPPPAPHPNGILSGGKRRQKVCIVLVVSRHTRSLQVLKSPNDTASSSFIPRPCLKVPTHSSSCSSFDIFTMGLIDTLGFCISVFGLVIYLRCLLPHNIIPTISSMLTDAEQSLALATTIGAVPEMSDYKTWLAVRRAYELYSLASQIVVMDLFLLGTPQTVVTPPSSVTADDTPAGITDPTPPVPVTMN
ncbi:hypothetical protein EDB86DRAFT_3245339 [Lactarius hatsudake]|nr:hypothetical protein EDB86DRAFT_3245339 [Lactarius hatsudake]